MHCGHAPNQNSEWAPPGLPCSAPMVLGDAVSFLSGVRGGAPTAVAFCCIECSQNASGFWTHHVRFFGQHCNEWQNEKANPCRLRSNLVSAGNLRHINIIVVQTGKLIFVRSELRPPKFCGPVQPNTSNMPKAGPVPPDTPERAPP